MGRCPPPLIGGAWVSNEPNVSDVGTSGFCREGPGCGQQVAVVGPGRHWEEQVCLWLPLVYSVNSPFPGGKFERMRLSYSFPRPLEPPNPLKEISASIDDPPHTPTDG